MAADLQEPASLVRDFFAQLETRRVRRRRRRPRRRATTRVASAAASRLFWWLYRRLVQPEIPPGGVDVFGCTRQVARQLVEPRRVAHEPRRAPLLARLPPRRGAVRASRPPVRARARWSFRASSRYLLDSIFSFTDLPDHADHVGLARSASLSSYQLAVVVFVAWVTRQDRRAGLHAADARRSSS